MRKQTRRRIPLHRPGPASLCKIKKVSDFRALPQAGSACRPLGQSAPRPGTHTAQSRNPRTRRGHPADGCRHRCGRLRYVSHGMYKTKPSGYPPLQKRHISPRPVCLIPCHTIVWPRSSAFRTKSPLVSDQKFSASRVNQRARHSTEAYRHMAGGGGTKPIPARPCRKNDGFSIALSVLRVSPEPMSTGSCGGSGPSGCSFCRMNAWDKNTNAILRHF